MTEATKTAFECVVSADLFKRAMAAISKEETRYYLNGVFVQACDHGGALLVATDGRRMLVLRDPNGYVANGSGIVTLRPETARALTVKSYKLPSWDGPLTGKSQLVRLLAVRGQRAAVVDLRKDPEADIDTPAILAMADNPGPFVGAYQWRETLIDGTYPDWRRVVSEPDFSGKKIGSFNAAMLAPLVAALADDDGGGCTMVPTKDGGELDAHYVFPANKSRVSGFGILMPLRRSETPKMPEWMSVPTKIAAE